jgi:phospholipase/carboxylesterase
LGNLSTAEKVMVMIHGRGASADSILSLSEHIKDKNIAFVAPQATQNTWYPYSFMAPLVENEPYLSSALAVIGSIIEKLTSKYHFPSEKIFLLGFSQGACLILEYVARNPKRYGGVFGLSGGLIGPADALPDYPGSLEQTPVFLGFSDVDFHIPKGRVLESEQIFKGMKANVLAKLYKNLPHTINDDELSSVTSVVSTGSF